MGVALGLQNTRETWGRLCQDAMITSAAREMPTDFVQAILGHASLQTTSIYVRAERRRMLDAAVLYYADDEA